MCGGSLAGLERDFPTEVVRSIVLSSIRANYMNTAAELNESLAIVYRSRRTLPLRNFTVVPATVSPNRKTIEQFSPRITVAAEGVANREEDCIVLLHSSFILRVYRETGVARKSVAALFSRPPKRGSGYNLVLVVQQSLHEAC